MENITGCLDELTDRKDKKTGKFIKTHGMCGTKIHKSWAAMKERCCNKNCKSYYNYGGRGITVCPEWLEFENFYKDMGDMPEGLTLDRIDNNGDYNKDNCKWSTKKEQQNNRRQNHCLTFRGKTKNIMQWSEELNINYHTLYKRIRVGWTIRRALNQ